MPHLSGFGCLTIRSGYDATLPKATNASDGVNYAVGTMVWTLFDYYGEPPVGGVGGTPFQLFFDVVVAGGIIVIGGLIVANGSPRVYGGIEPFISSVHASKIGTWAVPAHARACPQHLAWLRVHFGIRSDHAAPAPN